MQGRYWLRCSRFGRTEGIQFGGFKNIIMLQYASQGLGVATQIASVFGSQPIDGESTDHVTYNLIRDRILFG